VVPFLISRNTVFTITPAQLEHCEAVRVASFRQRLESFVVSVLSQRESNPSCTSISRILDETFSIADRGGFSQADHVARIAILIMARDVLGVERVEPELEILMQKKLAHDERLAVCAGRLGLGE